MVIILTSSLVFCGSLLFWQWQHKPELVPCHEMLVLPMEVSTYLSPVYLRFFMLTKL